MSGVVAFLRYDRKRFVDAADYLAIALVASLPWSTSATGILVVTWLLVLLPTLDWSALRREVATAAGGLPVLLVVLAALGMLWADVAWSERAAGLTSYVKLLVIPLLFVQFRRSERGRYAVYALLIACILLLAASYLTILLPQLAFKGPGVVVKDYISQSGFFTLCMFLLAEMAITTWREQRRLRAVVFLLLAVGFLANIVYVTTGRTALLVIPVLLFLFFLRLRSWKTALSACLIAALLAAGAWSSSRYLRDRVGEIFSPQTTFEDRDEVTSNELRLAFWGASIGIIKEAPLFGHGTGSIRPEFQRYGTVHPGSLVEHATNPHNQTFAVAIQLGSVGVAVLFAMWLTHLLMFRGPDFASWFGCVVVAQNIVGSLANSHLFDFAQGWTYAVCLGIAGGMARARDAARLHANSSEPAKRPV